MYSVPLYFIFIYVFNGEFIHFSFLADVIQMLETNGRVAVKEGVTELLKLPLFCHKCHKELNTIPALKDHLKSHIPHR